MPSSRGRRNGRQEVSLRYVLTIGLGGVAFAVYVCVAGKPGAAAFCLVVVVLTFLLLLGHVKF